MRKFILIVLMIAMCTSYFIYVKKTPDAGEMKVAERIERNKDSIESSYPSTANKVIEEHNELMSILYSHKMNMQCVDAYIEAIRMLYSDELLTLNSVEEQKAGIIAEVNNTEEENTIITTSEIKQVLVDKENKNIAQIEVIHYTNKGVVNRTYEVVNEKSMWKINNWSKS